MKPRTLMRQFGAFVLLLMVALLVASQMGCAQMGVPSPQTFGEKIVVAVSAVSAVRSSAGTLLAAKKISPDDAQNVQDQADNARKGIEMARSMRTTSPEAAQTKLDATITVLTALQAYLATRK